MNAYGKDPKLLQENWSKLGRVTEYILAWLIPEVSKGLGNAGNAKSGG